MLGWTIGTLVYDIWLKKTGRETISEFLGRNPEISALLLGIMYIHLNPRKGN
jgi:hypothetical protein